MHLYMEVADASGAFGTYDQWLQVQKTSVLLHYTEFQKIYEKNYGRKKGTLDVKLLVSSIENHLNKCVANTVIELEKLMRDYAGDNLIFGMLITSITDRCEGACIHSHNVVYIPAELETNVFYLCHILLLEHFNAKKKEGKKTLQKALDQMRSTLYQKTRNDYEYAKSGDIKWLVDDFAHSTASKCHVNPYVI